MRKRKQPPPKRLALSPNIWQFETEGITYVLDWDKFPINGFVFIKCLETDKVVASLKRHSARYRVKLTLRVGIRNGYWGVGVWRTK